MTGHGEDRNGRSTSTGNAGTAGGPGRVVVGVDGTDASLAALRWADEEARRLDTTLDVVNVYQSTPTYTFTVGGFAPLLPPDVDSCRGAALEILDDAIQSVGLSESDMVRTRVVEATSSVTGLISAANGAAMLVVGARHHHGIGNLIGSTAGGCIRHATFPVVAVPSVPTQRAGSGGRRSGGETLRVVANNSGR